ncbi:MAG: hypothetical protein A2Y03_10660 [Omnitrophica WOR_2 bacterium GWF2_38_59]|nr:MAG: hypothetical protein A2Y03_10660 [Omnitrophica WOR_2 bacterium GWF2_38_59]OGX51357.1 MAG: hypothetical protein A2243_04200 [Omnitrophica WOR_2 bacterium RIFOXYA2_FULL_38_17]OGX52226.1 MAG: hypothetical protein A2267_01450 [Omnitrophica WOR_2 bacterium RIFOXYA12_FULL_38_10]OGX55003.1 MAG: hypothetical protein A2447_10670 [Omnitrophica WOR_2 bacterium RIFOXYC2_FULL_38_12]OGX55184.1 MAG: hypothetical protein A2306_02465 [Omnitrophica WOR_2 bacterium RIFOXYB2_FULL_38_16]HAB53874.1 hypothet
MPGGNGLGPLGASQRRGFGGNNPKPNVNCFCPNCGERVPHQRGVPCNSVKCPKCGANMARE